MNGPIRKNAANSAVLLQIGGQAMAIPARSLRTILEPVPVTRVPTANRFVDGVVNVRGSVIPIADLRVAFGLAGAGDDDTRRFLVLEIDLDGEPATVAIVADAVHEVVELDPAGLDPLPATGTRWPQHFVRGLARSDSGFVMMPHLENIFAAYAGAAATAN